MSAENAALGISITIGAGFGIIVGQLAPIVVALLACLFVIWGLYDFYQPLIMDEE